jgi:hypothetical protein
MAGSTEKLGAAVIFFAKPACQPLLLLHGGQAFFHGRKESVVIFLSFWFFSAGSRTRAGPKEQRKKDLLIHKSLAGIIACP